MILLKVIFLLEIKMTNVEMLSLNQYMLEDLEQVETFGYITHLKQFCKTRLREW